MKANLKFTSLALLLGVGVFAFSGCKKIEDAIKINVPLTMTIPVTIQPVNATNGTGTYSSQVNVNIDSLIKANNSKLSVSNIKSVDVSSVSISINSDSQYPQDNLTALKSIAEYFYSNNNSNKIELGSVNNPTNPYTTDVPISNVPDLTNYFNATTFYFDTEYQMNRSTTHQINATATVKFTIQAGL